MAPPRHPELAELFRQHNVRYADEAAIARYWNDARRAKQNIDTWTRRLERANRDMLEELNLAIARTDRCATSPTETINSEVDIDALLQDMSPEA